MACTENSRSRLSCIAGIFMLLATFLGCSPASTQEGTFGLYPNNKTTQRIYSGTPENMVLTIVIDSPPGQVQGTVEILVDNAAITDGVITKYGFDSRTFMLKRAKTVDIALKSPNQVVTGKYSMSVPVR